MSFNLSFEFIYRYWNQVYTKQVYIKALFVCVKDRTRLRMAKPVYCLSIIGSIFGALFCLLIKKFILECDTI